MKFDDHHTHTALSYCAEEPIAVGDYADAIERGETLRTVAITNHGFALYFPEDLAWSWRFMEEPALFDEWREWGNRRLVPHLDEVDSFRDRGLRTGVEVEMMADGRLTVDPRLRDRLDVIVGSVHWLRSEGEAPSRILDEWMRHNRALVRAGIDILGHPLRFLAKYVQPLPAEVIPFVVDIAREAGVAIELNGHFVVDADLDLLLEAVRRDVPVTLSTDSHRFSEIGRFDHHLGVIASAGLRLEDLRLWRPSRRGPASGPAAPDGAGAGRRQPSTPRA